ncbi:MAG: DEAD/DEAH box helicase [Bradymonadaceae bacterium]
MTAEKQDVKTFEELGLSEPLLKAVAEEGFAEPTPIQSATIPLLLAGRDVVGKARTGTGKTAAYALPMLDAIDTSSTKVQALILTPTRELAIQVAEAIAVYGRHLPRVRTLPVYGGQSMSIQLSALNRPTHIVVGTPGRVMDHLRRKTLTLDGVQTLVLDEADEMLRMGFIDDVEWILEHTPKERRTALFSATMPHQIMGVARRHLNKPEIVTIEPPPAGEATIEQRYIRLKAREKLLALSRILQAEPCEGVLVFVRTRVDCATLAESLTTQGHRVEALHGDLSQSQRELVMSRFKDGHVEVVIGTDVAARGLDVDNLTHVINYDMPSDADTYTPRIGRTGRAGRGGVAILFATSNEMATVKMLERRSNNRMVPMQIPSAEEVAKRKVERFKESIRETLNTEKLDSYYGVVKELMTEGFHMTEIAAAAAFLTDKLKAESVPVPVSAKSSEPEHRKPSYGRQDQKGGRRRTSSKGKRKTHHKRRS